MTDLKNKMDDRSEEMHETLRPMPEIATLATDTIVPQDIDPVPGRPQASTPSLGDKPLSSRDRAKAARAEAIRKALN